MPTASATVPPTAPTPRRRAAERELRDRCRAGEHEHADAGHQVVGAVEQARRERGPSEKNSPPIDHDEITASAASRNARRTGAGTLGRCGVSRGRVRSSTGSGISSAPAKATAKSTSSST